MTQAIEQKKQQKFDAMVEKGAKIAAEQQDALMGKLVENTVNNKASGKADQKLAVAIINQAKTQEEEEAELAPAEAAKSEEEAPTTEESKEEENKIMKAIEEEAAAEAAGPDSGKILDQADNEAATPLPAPPNDELSVD